MGQGFVQPDAPPENTLPAFAEGWKIAKACELDVHLTKDGQVIVIHDDTTNRTTNASWIVRDHFAAELRSLDAGRWKSQVWAGTRLPLLEDVLDSMPDDCELFIELKDGPQVVPCAVHTAILGCPSASGYPKYMVPCAPMPIDGSPVL